MVECRHNILEVVGSNPTLVNSLFNPKNQSDICIGRFSNSEPTDWNCDFELDLCMYTQALDDNFDWTRHFGGTASTNTGPSVDHTKGDGKRKV